MTTDFVKVIYKEEKYVYLWIMFLILLVISFIFIGFKKYEQSNYYVGYFENNSVSFLIEEEKLTNLPKKVYLDNKKYEFRIGSISEEYVFENNIRYRLVTLISNFKTNSSVVDIKFMYEKTYLFNEILKIVKGGWFYKIK